MKLTRQDLPQNYLIILDELEVTEKYLTEVNKQNTYHRRRAWLADGFTDFVNRSFRWQYTQDGFCFWVSVALQYKKVLAEINNNK